MWAVESFCLSMGLSAAIHSLESVVPTPEEGQEDWDICTWAVALSSPPGSVAEGSTGGKCGKKLDLES